MVVKRYRLDSSGKISSSYMKKHKFGDYIYYDDYQNLENKNKELEERIKELEKSIALLRNGLDLDWAE